MIYLFVSLWFLVVCAVLVLHILLKHISDDICKEIERLVS
jgi:hypothetical protein